MKKNKFGFTLVELLGVIIILGVLALITFPIIDKSIKNSKEKALEKTIDSIEEAAYNYSINHDLGYEIYYNKISMEELKREGLLEKEIINPITNEIMDGCVIYKWNEIMKQYEFKYDEECKNILTVEITYDKEQFSDNNWTNKDVQATITGNGDLKYCISDVECNPVNDVDDNSVVVSNSGTNYLCAMAVMNGDSSLKKCEVINIDKGINYGSRSLFDIDWSFNVRVMDSESGISTYKDTGIYYYEAYLDDIPVLSCASYASICFNEGLDEYNGEVDLESIDEMPFENNIYITYNFKLKERSTSSGTHYLKIRIYDKAGNYYEAQETYSYGYG